ncbi:MAG TPA: antirestriction protein [Steroidobacter sp.]|uniref:antirestriction protein n=1 Tax=Steroidobacter sp. TaxID=1978227 RepID=UPI002ED7E863
MNHNDSAANSVIASQLVADNARLQILPKHFGAHHLYVENLVFVFARTLVPTYRGGYWRFYELSNGGFYMAPEMASARVCVEGNGFEGELTADAIGITVCLFAFSHGSFVLTGHAGETCARHYTWLREYSWLHPEQSLISAAID